MPHTDKKALPPLGHATLDKVQDILQGEFGHYLAEPVSRKTPHELEYSVKLGPDLRPLQGITINLFPDDCLLTFRGAISHYVDPSRVILHATDRLEASEPSLASIVCRVGNKKDRLVVRNYERLTTDGTMSLHADFIHASIEEHLCATVFVAHISRYVGLLLASETNVDYATKFIEVQGELYSQLYDKFCLSYFIPKQEKNESDPF